MQPISPSAKLRTSKPAQPNASSKNPQAMPAGFLVPEFPDIYRLSVTGAPDRVMTPFMDPAGRRATTVPAA